jgi:aminoglycoside phosphotransferase (APT) family kinase protein
MEQMSQHLNFAGTKLLFATSSPIDAPGYLSNLVGVALGWSAEIGAPTRAVLKVSHCGFGREELPFYKTIAGHLNCPVVPQFFAGGLDEATKRAWLLIEDLSASHERPSEAPLPPTFERSAQLVEALAQFHAAGWDRSSWHFTSPTLWERLRSSEWMEAACVRLFSQAGDALEERAKSTYVRLLSGSPKLIKRSEQLKGKTLVHGDAHVWNWMLPRDSKVDIPKLIDWDGWHIGVGVWDLAYMMALQWDRGVRKRFEAPLLDRYHAALQASGVTGYSREALQADYRLAVLIHLRTPISRFVSNMSAYVWWPQLARILDAVEDLDFLDLLD